MYPFNQLSVISYQFHAKVFARKNFSVEPKVSEAKSVISYQLSIINFGGLFFELPETLPRSIPLGTCMK